MKPIETERLLLRPWRDEDVHAFADLNADPQVMRHFPSVMSFAQSEILAGLIRSALAENGFGLWAVEEIDGAKFIGFIGLARPHFEAPFTPCVEIGWRLAAAHWGRGYATEGARAALRFGFDELGLDEIVSFTTTGNAASRRVMEKLAMRHDTAGDFEHPRVPVGHPLRPDVLYRLSRESWRES